MDTFLTWIGFLLKIALSVIVFGSIFLTFFGLPGNFIILLLGAVYFALTDGLLNHIWLFIILFALAMLGEAVELGAGAVAAKQGEVSRGVFAVALICGILGAIIGAPFYGIGAVILSLLGVYAGGLLAQYHVCNDWSEAHTAAKALFLGNLGGKFAKIMIGVPMAVLVIYNIFM